MTIGEKLFALRKKAGLTAKEAATQAGTSESTLLRMEKGKAQPKSQEMIEAFAKLYGCSVKELTDDSVDINKEATEKMPEKAPEKPPKKKVVQIASHGKTMSAVAKDPEKKVSDIDKLDELRKELIEKDALSAEQIPIEKDAPSAEQKPIEKTFGEKLHDLRTEKGMSLTQISEAVGIKKGAYQGFEYKNSRPRDIKVYDKLAEILGCDVAYLTDGDERFSPQKDAPAERKASDKKAKESVGEKVALVKAKAEKAEQPTSADKAKADKMENPAPTENPNVDAPFSEKLSTLRVDKGLGQQQMAEKLGMTISAYRRMENKNDRPETMEIYEKIAEILGCEVGYLTAGDSKISPQKDADTEQSAPSIPSTEPFGKRLSALRKAKNLTLAQTADKVGITQSAYKSMEYRNYRPKDIKVYNKLAKVLGCDVEYLKEGDKRFEKKAEKKVIIIPPKKAEKSEVPAEAPQPADLGEIEESIPVEAPAIPAEKSSASSEVIKLVSRLSVLLAGDEIGKDEKDAVMVALNGAYWR